MIVESLKKVWKPALLGLLLLLNCLAVRNLALLSVDLVRGDGSARNLWPNPVYPLLRIPAGPITEAYQAAGKLGADFAPIYFPAQDIAHLENAYDAQKTLGPWHQPSRSAPFVILACGATFCRLSFAYACLLEMLFQTLLFYGVLYWAFSECGLRKYFLYGALGVNLYLFLTPAGLSWFERGQFSLYLAAAYAVLMVSLLKRRLWGVAVAALLAFFKWTSFPPIFVILAVYLLSSRTLSELRSNATLVAVFALTALGLLLLPEMFSDSGALFVRGLVEQELYTRPEGMSLLQYAPSTMVKLMPLAAIVLGYIDVRVNRNYFDSLTLFAAGVVLLMLTYPTLAYEYGLPTLVGFVPLLMFWARQNGGRWSIPRVIAMVSFLVFLVTVSFSTQLYPSFRILVELYVSVSLILMVSPGLLALRNHFVRQPTLGAQTP